MAIDIWSVLIAGVVMAIVIVLLSLYTWLSAQKQVRGPGFWFAGFSFIAAGLVLLVFRGSIPDFISIFLANSLILTGVALKGFGFFEFLMSNNGKSMILLWGSLAVAVVLLYVFQYPVSSIEGRIIAISMANIVFGSIIFWHLFFRAPKSHSVGTLMAGALFLLYSMIFVFRILNTIHWSGGKSWLASGNTIEAIILVLQIVLLAGIAVTETQLLHDRIRLSLGLATEEMAQKNAELVSEVKRRTIAENQLTAMNEELSSTQKEIMITLSEVVEFRSKETALHVARVGEYTRALSIARGLPPDETVLIADAAPMHDIGKISVSDEILNKPSGLTDEEMETMRAHTIVGYNLLNKSGRPLIKMAALIALEHHEYWNGTGYPYGKSGLDISFAGRAVCLCDVFDALSSFRPYKEAWDLPRILTYIKQERGKMFDPELVDSLFLHLDEFLFIGKELKDKETATT